MSKQITITIPSFVMPLPQDEIPAAIARLGAAYAEMAGVKNELGVLRDLLQQNCCHPTQESDSGWGRMPSTYCAVCGKVLA